MNISLIGYGRLGKLISSFLSQDVDLAIFDKDIDRPIKDINSSNIVILAVPISSMEEVCKEIAPHLRESSLVIDVCSVKEYPMEVMKKYLPNVPKQKGTYDATFEFSEVLDSQYLEMVYEGDLEYASDIFDSFLKATMYKTGILFKTSHFPL